MGAFREAEGLLSVVRSGRNGRCGTPAVRRQSHPGQRDLELPFRRRPGPLHARPPQPGGNARRAPADGKAIGRRPSPAAVASRQQACAIGETRQEAGTIGQAARAIDQEEKVGRALPQIFARQARIRALLSGAADLGAPRQGAAADPLLVPDPAERESRARAVRGTRAARARSAVPRRQIRLGSARGDADSPARNRPLARAAASGARGQASGRRGTRCPGTRSRGLGRGAGVCGERTRGRGTGSDRRQCGVGRSFCVGGIGKCAGTANTARARAPAGPPPTRPPQSPSRKRERAACRQT
jgi:hypothetical protein